MLGTSDGIVEALALRKCDVDDTVSPMQVTVMGTLVVIKSRGVYRPDHPKTSASHRVLQVPDFTAEVLRRRLSLLEDADDDHLLFPSRAGTPLAPNNMRRTLAEDAR